MESEVRKNMTPAIHQYWHKSDSQPGCHSTLSCLEILSGVLQGAAQY